MAITMSGATIDDSLRETIKGDVNVSVIAGNESTELTGGTVVGIDAEFATSIKEAIDTYIDGIETELEKLETEVDPEGAFKGSGITEALKNFVTSVKEIAKNYITTLKYAEHQIINSVHSAYETQDTDLSASLNADSTNLESENS